MPPPLPTTNVRFPEWWGDAFDRDYGRPQDGDPITAATLRAYDRMSASVRVNGVEYPVEYGLDVEGLLPRRRTGSREDMHAAFVQAIHDTANEQAPIGTPHPDPEVVRTAADLVVQSMTLVWPCRQCGGAQLSISPDALCKRCAAPPASTWWSRLSTRHAATRRGPRG